MDLTLTVVAEPETLNALRGLAEALGRAVAAAGPATPAEPSAPVPAPDAPPAGPTKDDVRAALKAYVDKNGNEAGFSLLKGFGAQSLGTLDPAKYAEVIAKARA